MYVEANQWVQAFTANGDATGYATVADTSGFYVGAIAYLIATGLGARCVITEIKDATHVGVRIIADDNEQQQGVQVYGGRSNLSAYTTVGTAKLSMPAQIVKVEPNWVRPNIVGKI